MKACLHRELVLVVSWAVTALAGSGWCAPLREVSPQEVPRHHRAYHAIHELSEAGVVERQPGGDQQSLTRPAVAELVVRAVEGLEQGDTGRCRPGTEARVQALLASLRREFRCEIDAFGARSEELESRIRRLRSIPRQGGTVVGDPAQAIADAGEETGNDPLASLRVASSGNCLDVTSRPVEATVTEPIATVMKADVYRSDVRGPVNLNPVPVTMGLTSMLLVAPSVPDAGDGLDIYMVASERVEAKSNEPITTVDTHRAILLESVTLEWAPFTMSMHEVTNILPPVGDVISDSEAGTDMWRLGATINLPEDFSLRLSYATGSGSDPRPEATVGGVPVVIGARDFEREEFDITLQRPLYETAPQNGAMQGLRILGQLGYHQTVWDVPTSHDTYEGVTVGMNVSIPLAPQWTAEWSGNWMPRLHGGGDYDTIRGEASTWRLGVTYIPDQGDLFYRLGWEKWRSSGDTTKAAALASIPGATRFSFDEETSGLVLSVVWQP